MANKEAKDFRDIQRMGMLKALKGVAKADVSEIDTSENDISKSDTSKSDMSNIDISKLDEVSKFDTPSESDISKIDTLEAMKELNNASLFAVWKVLDSMLPGGEGEVSQRQLSQLMGLSLNSLKKYFRDLERRGYMEFNIQVRADTKIRLLRVSKFDISKSDTRSSSSIKELKNNYNNIHVSKSDMSNSDISGNDMSKLDMSENDILQYLFWILRRIDIKPGSLDSHFIVLLRKMICTKGTKWTLAFILTHAPKAERSLAGYIQWQYGSFGKTWNPPLDFKWDKIQHQIDCIMGKEEWDSIQYKGQVLSLYRVTPATFDSLKEFVEYHKQALSSPVK